MSHFVGLRPDELPTTNAGACSHAYTFLEMDGKGDFRREVFGNENPHDTD